MEATSALLAHDADAPETDLPTRADLLRTVHDSVVPGGYLARDVGAWLSLTEAELSRAKDEAAPALWREALLRIREVTYAEHELYAALRLAEVLAATGNTANRRGRARTGVRTGPLDRRPTSCRGDGSALLAGRG